MKTETTSNKEGGNAKIDELWLITGVCFVVCATFWLGTASQLQDFWPTIQNAFVVLAICYTVERVVVVSLPCLQRPHVTLHFGFGIVQNIIYVATFLASPSTFAEIWTSVYFGYYLWTWIVLVAHHQELFTIFRIFFTVHHTVSFFITGTWILVAAHCDCPYNLYLLRGIVLWLAADIWGYILNFTRSIYPGIPVRTIRRLQLMVFVMDRIQKSSAYIQAIAITHGNMNTLDWVVLGTGFFNDILDASFQVHSLYSYYRKEQNHPESEKTHDSDNNIESNATPNSSILAALGNDSQTTTTGKIPKPFVSSPPELKDLLLLPEFDKTTQWELLPKDFQRLTQERLKLVAQTGAFQISRGPGMGSGNTTEPEAFMRLLDAFHWAGLFDLSLFDVVGVHAIGGNVVFIHGDDSQLAENRTNIDQIEDVYCFGATELAHGSNLKQIQTIAEFDDKTNEVVLITPSSTACKYWIGNSTFVADYVVVLSRLVVKGEEQGIGWLRVPLWKNKDKTECFPGIHVRDTGAKAGCNGIGNGCITFDHVRLPRSALLSRFCQVDENGDFQSALSSSDLFLRSIQTFVLERIGVATAAIGCAKSAIHVALSYAAVRHQFGPDGDEVPLISYPMHQRRLISHAVRLFVGKATVDRIGRAAQESFHPYEFGADRKKLHAESCLVKAFASWESFAAAQEARELCGGHSFAATSQLGMA
ncbi:Acyl-coenzyme A oxidase [Seminavis robusta]|uniref:Acyl-coenzyme A oxidase n=1 Tax=Seminavis robusta TaxID=568900 RepID=A0A9N8EW56_9STRA|nr:Acyl-coenzyme A oxidase [Seminavis robusta]|eukprot:Sro2092_g314070.1 Acyl-coenzyme A oxidase (703) ;mRNA; f:6781-8961